MRRIEAVDIWLKELLLIKILRNKAFNIATDPRYDGHQRGLASMVYNFFNKKTKDSYILINVHLKIKN